MSRMSRLAVLGVVAGLATSLAAPAQASGPDCVTKPCYQCVMYPCGPGDWVPFLRDRACAIAGC